MHKTAQNLLTCLEKLPKQHHYYYLSILLLSVVSAPIEKVQYIRQLIKCGADVNFVEPHGNQMLFSQLCCQGGLLDYSESMGAERKGKSVLMVACEMSVVANVRELLRNEDLIVGAQDKLGNTALHYSLLNKNEQQSIQMLTIISKQFPHLFQSPKSLLFSCIQLCKQKILIHLLQYHNLNPNEQNQPLGLTPLQYTISLSGQLQTYQVLDIVGILLTYQADPYVKNYFGEDAFQFAEKYLFLLGELVEERKGKVEVKGKGKGYVGGCWTGTYANTNSLASNEEYLNYQEEFEGCVEQLKKLKIGDKFTQKEKQEFALQEKPLQQLQKQNLEKYGVQQQISQQKDCIEDFDSKQIKNNYVQFFCQQHELPIQKEQQIIEVDNHSEIQCNQFQIQSDFQVSSIQNSSNFQEFHHLFSSQLLNHTIPYYQTYNIACTQIQCLLTYLTNLSTSLNLKLQLIGSFATGLWTQYSDIDIVLINQRQIFINIQRQLRTVYKKLKASGNSLGIKQIFLNIQTEYPNVKIKMNDEFGGRRIDIGVFQRKCSGRKYVQFINGFLVSLPVIRPLFFVLFSVLKKFELHRPTDCGLKTYTIFLMILTSLQAYPQYSTISQAFITLVFYFSNPTHYSLQQPSCQHSSIAFQQIFNMMDPLNPSNNTGGRNTDGEKLMNMFKSIKYLIIDSLNQCNAHQLLEQILEIHRVF